MASGSGIFTVPRFWKIGRNGSLPAGLAPGAEGGPVVSSSTPLPSLPTHHQESPISLTETFQTITPDLTLDDLDADTLRSLLAGCGPDLAHERVTLLFDFLDALPEQRPKRRITEYDKYEKAMVYSLAGVRLAVDHRQWNPLPCRDQSERLGVCWHSVRRMRSGRWRQPHPGPGRTSIPLVGVACAGRPGRDPDHDHLHLIVALPIDDGDALEALVTFRRRRNANLKRSVYVRDVERDAGGPDGLIGYWQGRKNLRIRGAKAGRLPGSQDAHHEDDP